MRYRRGWNGMTEIVWDEVMEGNTVREPQKREKVIQMENIRPRKAMRQRQAAGKRSGRRKWIIRKKELLLIRLSIQAAAMMTAMIMICMLDAADMLQTIILMPLILGCMAVVLIIGDKKER